MDAEGGELNESFLDTLTCGLGGMLLMFLVLATLNHVGSRDADSRQGLAEDLPPMEVAPQDDPSRPRKPPQLLLVHGVSNIKDAPPGNWHVLKCAGGNANQYLVFAPDDGTVTFTCSEGVPRVETLVTSSGRTVQSLGKVSANAPMKLEVAGESIVLSLESGKQ